MRNNEEKVIYIVISAVLILFMTIVITEHYKDIACIKVGGSVVRTGCDQNGG